jgi:HD-GYP domain-containing protein (c-di-GMP phosphodiesterase class II)
MDKLYNSTIINNFLKLVKARYSYINILELLQAADMEPYQVEDESCWFTQDQVDRFYEKLVRLTMNPRIAREAGLYSASPEALGTMKRYVMGMLGPGKVFEKVEQIANGYTRSSRYSSRRLGRRAVEIIVTPNPGVQERPYQCENRIGYFEAIVRVFNHRMPHIEHTECMFSGGSVCRYRISWQESPGTILRWIRNSALLFGGVGLGSVWFSPVDSQVKLILTAGSLTLLLGLSLLAEHRNRKELIGALDNLRSSTDQLLDTISINYNHALMINEIGQTISKHIQVDRILSGVVEVLRKYLDFDRGLILLVNPEGTFLEYRAGYGYSGEQLAILKATRFHLDNPNSRGIFVVCYREKKPYLINNVEEILDTLSPHSLEFARFMGSKAFICCPILYEEQCLGILAVDNILTKRPLLERDLNLLMGIAPEIGISIRNALMIEAQQRQFQSVLQTLAASIDARDFLTAGHSEKVTTYAVGICRELGLSREYTEMIRVASQLHDYGKIGIRDSILKKPGPLSPKEREEIKAHAEKTEQILRNIHFEGIYREVPSIAGAHHEWIDGSGYPRGLKGEQIPLGARIIAVADFFEAITAKRHYREPMSFEQALAILREESGRPLDPMVVEAFIGYITGVRRLKPYDPAFSRENALPAVSQKIPAVDPGVSELHQPHPELDKELPGADQDTRKADQKPPKGNQGDPADRPQQAIKGV